MMKVFNFRFIDRNVRAMFIGEMLHFVFKDVCDALEIADPAASFRQVRERDRGKAPLLDSNRHVQPTLLITEPGLYRFVARSNMQKAEPFQDWLFEEVVPQIRKTGTYAVNPELETYVRDTPRLWSRMYSPDVRALVRASGWDEPKFYNFLYENGLLPQGAMDVIKTHLRKRPLYGRYRWVWKKEPKKEVMLHQFFKDMGIEANSFALGQMTGLMMSGLKRDEVIATYTQKAIEA